MMLSGHTSCAGGRQGFSLVEALLATGVLAVALPLLAGVMVAAGQSGVDARADTRSTWMASACVAEIEALRGGRSCWFPAVAAGAAFPQDDEVWALGFGADGGMVARVPTPLYQKGLRQLDGKRVSYIMKLAARHGDAPAGLMQVTLTLEYPAAAAAAQRRKLRYHTYLP